MKERVFNTILKCGSRSFNPDWGFVLNMKCNETLKALLTTGA